jgi:hypothetical protein
MTNVQKSEIMALVEREVKRLGNATRLATRLDVSQATVSQIRNGKFELITDQMWAQIATKLNYQSTNSWTVVPTLNYKMMWQLLDDAKDESMFFAISAKAGTGKTATLREYTNHNAGNAVFFVQCREWSRRDFILELCRQLGIDTSSKGYVKMDALGEMIVDYFNSRRASRPLLVIDEADKLRPAALRFLIPLYNATEGVLGCVISGTDNLEKEIKRGVKYNTKGYDEIDSRFGRQFVHLVGATRADVKAICAANGIPTVGISAEIFKEAGPRPVVLDGNQTMVVDDLRRLKRIILRERLKLRTNGTEATALNGASAGG